MWLKESEIKVGQADASKTDLAWIIHEHRCENAQKPEPVRRALFKKAKCTFRCSPPLKTSPTLQTRAFQWLQ
jgi:hypothetical protein